MDKQMRIFLSVILLAIIATTLYLYYSGEPENALKDKTTYDGIEFPSGTLYTVDQDGDIALELVKEFKIGEGQWPPHTKFFFDGAKLGKIEVPQKFRFAGLQFHHPSEFLVENYPPNVLYKMKVSKKIKIDGLDLHPDCEIDFRNYILYAASCPEFGTVYFKRFIQLPIIQDMEAEN